MKKKCYLLFMPMLSFFLSVLINLSAQPVSAIQNSQEYIVVAIDKQVISGGFIVEPTIIPLNKTLTAQQVLLHVLQKKALTYEYSDSEQKFLSVQDKTYAPIQIPDYILKYHTKLNHTEEETNGDLNTALQIEKEKMLQRARENEGYLTEGDYTAQSEFLITVNNKPLQGQQMPLKHADVIRMSFSLCSGDDLGIDYTDGYTPTQNMIPNLKREPLFRCIAQNIDYMQNIPTEDVNYKDALRESLQIVSMLKPEEVEIAASQQERINASIDYLQTFYDNYITNISSADIDCSGCVNASDLICLLTNYGTNEPSCNIDKSGTVNAQDLIIILSLYGMNHHYFMF